MPPISAITLLKETFAEFQKDDVPREAAALSYYTIFAIAPLLLVLVALGGIFLGEKAARGEIVRAVDQFTGRSGAEAIEEMIVSSSDPDSGRIALLIGIAGLIVGASTASMHLKQALNAIWQLPRKKKEGILGMVTTRALSLTVVLGVGFILLASLAVSTVISAIGTRITDRLQGGDIMWRVADITLSVAVITLLFGMLYKFLPDLRIAWKDVWLGGFFTAMLFVIGKLLLGVWLGAKSFDSTWGAAASFAILLVWIYFSSMIFFFGAEFTQVHAKARGRAPEPWQEEKPSAEDPAQAT